MPSNVTLVQGWFRDSVPNFLNEVDDAFCFVHLDADTYVSTLEVLKLIKKRIKSGTVIVFDEYIGIPNWQNHEHRAWIEFTKENKLKYEFIAFAPQGAALKVL